MLFIPFFKEIDWSKPPLITLFLILVNCLVFFIFQSDDNELAEKAYKYYLDSELPKIEIPLYIQYLNEKGDWEKAQPYENYLESLKEQSEEDSIPEPQDQREQSEASGIDAATYQLLMLTSPMKMDSGFYQSLQNGKLFNDKQSYEKWETLNSEFDSQINKVVTFSHGLKPNNPTFVTLFTNMFLHGGFGHLLGNMIFLFIIGFVVEAALGKAAYSSGYILAGLMGGLLYILFNSNSHIPTVGASGAIAGLMGMYTVLFGLRKINFFYYVFVYFDYVKAPAIILLPIWLGHELYQQFSSSNDGVNYFAHIGGICSGALFAFVMKHYVKKVNIEYLDQNEKEEQRNDQFETAMDYLAKMQVTKALPILRQLVKEHPGNRDYLLHWYKAAKMQPDTEDYHNAANLVMLLKDKDPKTYQLIYTTYQEYMRIAKPKARMDVQLCLHLILVFALGKYFDDAERLVNIVKNHKLKDAVAETVLILANAFQKSNEQAKSLKYLKLIMNEFTGTAASTEAQNRLQTLQEPAS